MASRGKYEEGRTRGGHRGRRSRGGYALPPGQEGVVGRRPDRAQGADLRLYLACRGAATAIQRQLLERPVAQVLGQALQVAAGRDRPGCRIPTEQQYKN